MPKPRYFYKRLQEVAHSKKKYQADIVRDLKKDSGTVSRWWHGDIVPGPKNMRELADYFGCDVKWLATDEKEANGKVLATIEPGDKKKKQELRDVKPRITQTDRSLREVVEWMDEYFGEDPDQILGFVAYMIEHWPSFKKRLQKKGTGQDISITPQEKLSANGNK